MRNETPKKETEMSEESIKSFYEVHKDSREFKAAVASGVNFKVRVYMNSFYGVRAGRESASRIMGMAV